MDPFAHYGEHPDVNAALAAQEKIARIQAYREAVQARLDPHPDDGHGPDCDPDFYRDDASPDLFAAWIDDPA